MLANMQALHIKAVVQTHGYAQAIHGPDCIPNKMGQTQVTTSAKGHHSASAVLTIATPQNFRRVTEDNHNDCRYHFGSSLRFLQLHDYERPCFLECQNVRENKGDAKREPKKTGNNKHRK